MLPRVKSSVAVANDVANGVADDVAAGVDSSVAMAASLVASNSSFSDRSAAVHLPWWRHGGGRVILIYKSCYSRITVGLQCDYSAITVVCTGLKARRAGKGRTTLRCIHFRR